jgi:hypothetical protein
VRSLFLLLLLLAAAAIACTTTETASEPCADAGDAEVGTDATAADAARESDAADAAIDAGEIGVFCKRAYAAARDAFARCCSPAEKATKDYALVDALYDFAVSRCSALAESRAKGRIAWDGAAADACIATIEARFAGDAGACNGSPFSVDFHDPGCVHVVTGLGNDGAAECKGAVDCKDGLVCGIYSGVGYGICTTPASLHLSCTQGLPLDGLGFGDHPAPCLPGLYCSQGQCVARAGSGGACGADDECSDGLHCALSTCGTDPPRAAAASCDRSSDCADGLFCRHVGLTTEGTCTPRKTAGEACVGQDVNECTGVCSAGTCASFCGAR